MTKTEADARLADAWPALPLDGWLETYASLHLWTQIVGKTRLALAPMQNHWWQVTLYVTARGLGTSPIPYGERTLELEFDFVDHRLVARASDGRIHTLPLVPQATADFYEQYLDLLRSLDVEVRIWPVPSEIANPIPFTVDRVHASYDAEAAHRLWRVLVQIDRVLKQFRGSFVGKCSPVHFWWGAFDLSCTRFSGRRAPPHPGGVPNVPDRVTREGYSHECISAGWWPGSEAGPVREPAFYAYAYPEPLGCSEATIQPRTASYHPELHEWILPYAAVLEAQDRDAVLLEFLHSTYDVAASLGGWDREALDVSPRS
ncbi:MAG TPA: DUF5996 family protein [Candidatus Limnocylindria bacterium]|nr:DUF5996 family protein [Candidatus Limnocylindria bacterium]